ncbi:MAG: Smr/MutS family protein [Myxococcota bacterium]
MNDTHDSQGSRPADPDAAIRVPIGDEIDLHSFAPRDVVDVARSYLEAARARGLRHLRLIHGKGRGVQRAQLQRMLASHPHVEAWSDAPPERGGWGATLVTLRPV